MPQQTTQSNLQTIPEPKKTFNPVWIMIVTLVITNLIVGWGVYFIINKKEQNKFVELKQQINQLEKQLNNQKNEKPASINTGAKQVRIQSDSPYVLADGETKIILEKGGSLNGVLGRPVVTIGSKKLNILPVTIIANKGYIFNISTPYDCETRDEMQGDMGVTIINACMFKIVTEQKVAPLIKLEKLSGNFIFDIEAPVWYWRRTSQMQKIEGLDKHFIGVRLTDADKYKIAGSGDNIFVNLTIDIITNFGIENIFIKDQESKEIVIGPERIKVKLTSLNQVAENKIRAQLSIDVESTIDQKGGMIIDYSESVEEQF